MLRGECTESGKGQERGSGNCAFTPKTVKKNVEKSLNTIGSTPEAGPKGETRKKRKKGTGGGEKNRISKKTGKKTKKEQEPVIQ